MDETILRPCLLLSLSYFNIAQWSKRNLTVLGRVTVVKSLLMSKLTYLILTLPDPPEDIELNVVFLTSSGKDKTMFLEVK